MAGPILLQIAPRLVLLMGGRFLSATPGVPQAEPPAPLSSLSLYDPYTADAGKARPIVQRRAGTNSARIPVVVRITGGNGNPHIQARVVKVAGQVRTPVTDWETLESVSIAGDDVAGLIPVDVPIDQRYALEARDGANPDTVDISTQEFDVGALGILLGQSNQVTTLGGSHAPAIPGGGNEWDNWQAGNVAACLWGVPGFYPLSTSIGSGSMVSNNGGGQTFTMRVLAKAMEVTHGKKVSIGICPWAWNSTALADMTPGSASSKAAIFNNSGTTAGTMGLKSPAYIFCGDYEFVVVIQGEAESNGTRAARLSGLINFCEKNFAQVEKFGRSKAQLGISVMVPGSYGSGASNMEFIRSAALDLDAHAITSGWGKVRAFNLVDMDVDTGDGGLHFGGEHLLKAARRQAHQAMWLMGCAPYPARGPKLVSGTRSGDVTTLNVEHDGGTALQTANAGAVTGFKVWDANGQVVAAASVAISGASTFALTCPGGTAYPIKVGFAMGMKHDATNPPTDDAPYPFVDNGSGGNVFSGSDVRVGLPLMHTPADQLITVA